MIFIGYDSTTGRPLGFAASSNAAEAAKNWPGQAVVEYQGQAAPDLATLWIEDGTLITRTDQGAAEDLEAAKKAARRALAEEINQFIAAKTEAEGGGKRYDQAWQIGAMALKMDYQAALAAGGLSTEQETAINARLALIKSVQDWIYAVRGVLFAKRAAINAAPDLAGVAAVTWDLSPFKIGATGDGANPDPDVYMDQLVIA